MNIYGNLNVFESVILSANLFSELLHVLETQINFFLVSPSPERKPTLETETSDSSLLDLTLQVLQRYPEFLEIFLLTQKCHLLLRRVLQVVEVQGLETEI